MVALAASTVVGKGIPVPLREILVRGFPPSDHTSAWIAGAVAVIVALIAAGTAQWRLRAQLDHDRELADLADLRTVVQDATVVVFESLARLSELAHTKKWLAELQTRQSLEESVAEVRAATLTVERLMATVMEGGEGLVATRTAALIRLPPKHPFIEALGSLQTARPLLEALTEALRADDAPEIDKRIEEYRDAVGRVRVEALKVVGSRIPRRRRWPGSATFVPAAQDVRS